MDRRRKAVETKMRRMLGASVEHAQAVRATFENADDLYSHCPRCGFKRVGTMAEVVGPCPRCSDATG